MNMQNLLPETTTVTFETIQALEEASARLLRALRHAAPQVGHDAGAIEYESWLGRFDGTVEYDSWAKRPR